MSIFKIACVLHPKSTKLNDKSNRMKLHLACMSGKSYEHVILPILNEQQQRQQQHNNNTNNNNEIYMNIINYIPLKYPNGTKLHGMCHRLPAYYALENGGRWKPITSRAAYFFACVFFHFVLLMIKSISRK